MTPKELFEILVREHADMLTVYLRCAVRDAAQTDDLFQETMMTAWRNLDKFDRSRPFGPWLRGIAAKLILAQHRRDARRPLLCDEVVLAHLEARHVALAQTPGDTLDEKLEILRDCLAHLPELYRHAVELRYREGLRGPRLAERLEISLEAVKKRLQRARARLLACLERKLAPLERTT
jgi:RNA polymerase sigma-70 factor